VRNPALNNMENDCSRSATTALQRPELTVSIKSIRAEVATLPLNPANTITGEKMKKVLDAVGTFVDKEEFELVKSTRGWNLDKTARAQLDAFDAAHPTADARFDNAVKRGLEGVGVAGSLGFVGVVASRISPIVGLTIGVVGGLGGIGYGIFED
jgi:ribosomal protein L12E/L44/L45/RPP1/RPP2